MPSLKDVGYFFLGAILMVVGLAFVLGIPVAIFAGGFPYIHGTGLHNSLKTLISIGGIIGVAVSIVTGIKVLSFGIDYIKL